MPTRSYYFPSDFRHLEEILRADEANISDGEISYYRERGIPPLRRPGNLSLFLGISPKTIYSVRKHPHKHYRSFTIPKKDGTRRQIDTPRTYLKVMQWWILDNILNKLNVEDYVFGFVIGRSAVDNAEYHRGASHLLNVDIDNFFPSIAVGQVFEAFIQIGFSTNVSRMLSELCCLDGRIPQGAPTSPALANLVGKEMDRKLMFLGRENQCLYSRYADDLVFSSRQYIPVSFLVEIERLVSESGFSLKKTKTRFAGSGDRMEVTGVVINEVHQPSRKWRRKVRARIFNLSKTERLKRKDLQFLHGIRGMANQYSGSISMSTLSASAELTYHRGKNTVIGIGDNPILPSSLTLKEAQVLVSLHRNRSNSDVASTLGITVDAVKGRLRNSFRKIGVSDRMSAMKWAINNL